MVEVMEEMVGWRLENQWLSLSSRGSRESRSGLEFRARRTSIAKQAMKMPARQEETRMVSAMTFKGRKGSRAFWVGLVGFS